MITGKTEFPAYFENGLQGIGATEDIEHREMVFAVPWSIVFSMSKALKEPALKKVYSENPDLFDKEKIDLYMYLVMVVFLLFERQKGK